MTTLNYRAQRPSALSQALRALHEEQDARERDTRGQPLGSETDPFDVFSLEGPTMRLRGARTYAIRIAGTLNERKRAWALAYDVYREKGFSDPDERGLWYGAHDALPDTVTFLAEERGDPVATVTLVFDSDWRLPADEVYGPELAPLRARGRKLCELVSLVNKAGGQDGLSLLKHLFKLAYLTAHHLEGAGELLVTVHPRHARFYERGLLFRQLAGLKPCGKVKDAPAVLLGLDLQEAWETYRARFEGLPADRDLYRFFLHRAEDLRAWIRRHRAGLDAEEIRRAFVEERRVLSEPAYEQVVPVGTARDPGARPWKRRS